MCAWLKAKLDHVSGRCQLAEAIRYALGRWDQLSRFLPDGRINLETNPVERAIRPAALGLGNALFAESEGSADRWAVVAYLIETCKLHGVEPFGWLRNVLMAMATGHSSKDMNSIIPF